MLLLVCCVSGTSGAQSPGSPREVIVSAAREVVTALKVNGDDIRRSPVLARRLVEDSILPLMDFRRTAPLLLGTAWRKADGEQRCALISALTNFVRGVLVSGVRDHGQSIVTYYQRAKFPPSNWLPGQDKATVRVVIRLDNGLPLELALRMALDEGKWVLYDVVVGGISFVVTYRGIFADSVRRQGLDELIRRLNSID